MSPGSLVSTMSAVATRSATWAPLPLEHAQLSTDDAITAIDAD
jgi:hypothetical protein